MARIRAALEYDKRAEFRTPYADRCADLGHALSRENCEGLAPNPRSCRLLGRNEGNDLAATLHSKNCAKLYNCSSGLHCHGENQIVDSAYPYYLSNFFEPPQRVRRIYQLLESQEHATGEDMARLQLDQFSLHAVELIQALSADLRAVARPRRDYQSCRDKIARWDGDCAAASIPAAIFHVFHQHLLANLLRSALGDEVFGAYTEILNQCIVPTDKILRDEKSCWFANDQSIRHPIAARTLAPSCAKPWVQTVDAGSGAGFRVSLNHVLQPPRHTQTWAISLDRAGVAMA